MRKGALRLAVCGAGGRMGRSVRALAEADPGFSVAALAGRRFPLTLAALRGVDVAVDFSVPDASLRFAKTAARARVPLVTGTTGFSPAQERLLKAYARRIPLLKAPNMSPGMSLLFDLARRAASALPAYDAVVLEAHHSAKKDAPSGSALKLMDAARGGRRRPVPALSVRAGGIVGDHTLLLAGPEERLELTHRAQSRDVFARGALAAARWLVGRRPGLYSMTDVLGL